MNETLGKSHIGEARDGFKFSDVFQKRGWLLLVVLVLVVLAAGSWAFYPPIKPLILCLGLILESGLPIG